MLSAIVEAIGRFVVWVLFEVIVDLIWLGLKRLFKRGARQFDGGRLVTPVTTRGKVREIGELLAPHSVEVISAGELGLDEPEETGTTFVENAVIKAEAAAEVAQLPALADDSGLAVHALGGAPGVHSARWAGPGRDFGFAMRKLEDALEGKTDRSAHFACALALCWPTAIARPSRARFTARWSGRRAASAVSATTRSSSRTAMRSPSARWSPSGSIP